MARNAIESEFRTSKMADGSHFVKIKKKNKVAYWSKMAKNAFKSEFLTSKMGTGGHFVFWKKSFVLIWNGQKKSQKLKLGNGKKWFLDIQNG